MLGRLTESDVRNKASKFTFVGESVEIEAIEDLLGLFQDMFRSSGLSRQVSSSELTHLMLQNVVTMVREICTAWGMPLKILSTTGSVTFF